MHSLCNHIMAWRQILSGKICTDLGYSNILRFVCSIGISRGILWPSCLSHFRFFFRCCRRCYDIALVFPEQKHPWDKSKELQIWLEFLPGRSLFATRKSPPKLEENRLRREQGCLPELISATGRFGRKYPFSPHKNHKPRNRRTRDCSYAGKAHADWLSTPRKAAGQ